MLLLHNGRAPEESVRSFFTEASELFAKHIMNPFAIVGAVTAMDSYIESHTKRQLFSSMITLASSSYLNIIPC